ncbi:MAG: sensor domain-containing diguanylate cyclase, partial [Dehalococcoidia bacterium]
MSVQPAISAARAALRRAPRPSLPFLSLLLAGVAAAAAVIFLQRYVESRENERLALEQVESSAQSISIIEWQSIANGRVDSDTASSISSAIDALHASMEPLAHETELHDGVTTYAAAVRDELLLIAIGQIDEAKRIDAERVDPAFSAIKYEIDAEQARHGDEAAHARTVEQVGAIATIALTIGAISFILRRLRAREVALLERNAAAALQASESFRLAVLESTADGIVTIDELGLIESFNPAAERLFGYRASEVLGHNAAMLMPEPLRDIHNAFLQSHRDIVGKAREIQGQRKDGEAFPVEISVGEAHVGGRRVYVGSMRDITLRKQLEEQLRRQAFHDSLTGLANRATFADRLDHALARRRRSQQSSFAVLFLDLDDFKSVNDVHGHPVGDDLLVAVAQRLAGCVRPEDTLARFGGDEFALLLEDIAGRDDATAAADHILATLAAPFAVAGTAVIVGTSIGIA